LLASWLGLAVLGIFLVRFTRETYNDYYLIVTAPAWWLLISAGLLFFWQQARRRWRLLALAGLALLVGGNGLSLYNYYFDPAHSRTSGYREMAARIATDGGPHDLFLAHFPDPSLDYYLRNLDLPIEVQPAEWGAPPEATENRLAELAYQYERIWFVPYLNTPWDPVNVVGSWLDYHMLHERHEATGRMTLWAFRSVAFAPDIMTAESTTFGELITLTGIYATVDGQPVDLAQPVLLDQANNLTITLLWQTDLPLSDNYTVFVHLLDETGWMVAQHDGVPLFGTRPTTTWQPGERLLDRHEIVLPGSGGLGSGNGRIIVGLYHSETIERLPPAPTADALTVGRWGVENGR
jgi:mannosyltransferase